MTSDQILDWGLVRVQDEHAVHLDMECVARSKHDALGGSGNCIWVGESDSRKVGVAFEWEIANMGIPVIANPMEMVSNMVVMHGDKVATEAEQICTLLRLMNRNSWHEAGVDSELADSVITQGHD